MPCRFYTSKVQRVLFVRQVFLFMFCCPLRPKCCWGCWPNKSGGQHYSSSASSCSGSSMLGASGWHGKNQQKDQIINLVEQNAATTVVRCGVFGFNGNQTKAICLTFIKTKMPLAKTLHAENNIFWLQWFMYLHDKVAVPKVNLEDIKKSHQHRPRITKPEHSSVLAPWWWLYAVV